ncbi:hypothetical protein JYU34_013706 [Plutella xylostella]|uniref:Protein FAM177A1 n=1 Tax=Plutella xylostella TaxID=51655 RepID=A0ABQ7QAH9_PLUXY|nr:protein FAM177A1 [Plutella xylostella]KAG7302226.1 hypothetical protein JYU34_013706 [Plutella xylostella]
METRSENGAENQTEITINRRIKILHFSDGVEEVMEEVKTGDLQSAPGSKPEDNVDPATLSWGPWFSHYAWKSGTKVLGAIDTAGESLAGFFGITSPKYQIEVDEYERVKEEKKKLDDESSGWVPKNGGGDIPLVLEEPGKDIEKAVV